VAGLGFLVKSEETPYSTTEARYYYGYEWITDGSEHPVLRPTAECRPVAYRYFKGLQW
jgi:hypothetical protein